MSLTGSDAVARITLNDSCQVFVGSAETIRHSSMPLSVHVLRLLCRNSIVLGHNMLIVPVVLIGFGIRPSAWAWTAAPGLLLLLFGIFWASLLLGLLGARFRDITQIVSNVLQLLFFLTPIFWPLASLAPEHAGLIALNPVFAFIDIIRSPLLGVAPSPSSWPIALGVSAATAIIAYFALSRLRRHVAYWV